MPAVNQFTWSHKELVTLMVKEAGVHEGRWGLLLNYGITPGNFGPSEDQISPGIIVAVVGIGIQREQPGLQIPSSMLVDAAEVNPATASGVPGQSSSRSAGPSSSPEPSGSSPRRTRRQRP
jgi:hypothetical protein